VRILLTAGVGKDARAETRGEIGAQGVSTSTLLPQICLALCLWVDKSQGPSERAESLGKNCCHGVDGGSGEIDGVADTPPYNSAHFPVAGTLLFFPSFLAATVGIL
jgi:hypothetical protein